MNGTQRIVFQNVAGYTAFLFSIVGIMAIVTIASIELVSPWLGLAVVLSGIVISIYVTVARIRRRQDRIE